MQPQLVEHRLDARDGSLRYITYGTGSPLFLCHGFLGSAENFRHWTADLATRRRVIIPDLPGCGTSSALTGHHSSINLATSLLQIVENEVGPDEKIDIGGLCLGADVAVSLATLLAPRVRSLLLHTPLLEPEHVRQRFHVQARAMMAPGIFPSIVWLSRQRVVSDLYKRFVVEGEDVAAGEAELNFLNQCRADPRATKEWLLSTLRSSQLHHVKQLEIPTLVIAAKNDLILDVTQLSKAVRALPFVTLAIIDEAGHGWDDEYIKRQNMVIVSYLDHGELPSFPWISKVA